MPRPEKLENTRQTETCPLMRLSERVPDWSEQEAKLKLARLLALSGYFN